MKTIAEQLNHDFDKGSLCLYDSNGNEIYYEQSTGYWEKNKYDSNGKKIYYKDSDGIILDNRPKESCEGKVVEIDGKRYQLKEVD